MPADQLNAYLRTELATLKEKGLYKAERRIETPQLATIQANGKTVVNFCANNYLGLANHPEIVQAAHDGLNTRGYGLSSVRFICGTQDIQTSRSPDRSVLRQGRQHSLYLLLRCEWRALRTAAHREGRDSLR